MGTKTTFAALIAAPESEKVFLCEAKPGERISNLVQATIKYLGFTGYLSLVTGYVFVSGPSHDISDDEDKYLTLVDGAGKKCVLKIGAAGIGATSVVHL